MTRIQITLDDAAAQAALARLAQRLGDMRPVLKDVGESLLASTKDRFAQQRGPDGAPWAPLSDATLLATMRRAVAGKGLNRRGGGTRVAAVRALARRRALVGETRALSSQFGVQVDAQGVTLSTSMVYAAVHQFGMARGATGRRTRHGRPIPFGDVPARPFIGLSSADRVAVLNIVARALAAAR